MPKARPQRVRDPVHNLIEFGTGDLEQTLWLVVQTPPFQRLRRIRQLGFSEFVFPGATHTRFAHSLGVFHIARALMKIIERHLTAERGQIFHTHSAQVALAAALVHDIGHGMFSHSFESIGDELNLEMAHHERISELLIRDSEITGELNKAFGSGFSNDVADLIAKKEPGSLYDAVVSSQFDADRLDYMQRDRLMTGVQSSGIDLTWLLANLEVSSVSTGADDTATGEIETLVLGPKAAQTAESYVLSLFHLYPNVYLHKTTRGSEALFANLFKRTFFLHRNGNEGAICLEKSHPILRFVSDPNRLERAVALDDLVFWGALPLLAGSSDEPLSRMARALHERRLLSCIDIHKFVEAMLPPHLDEERRSHQARISLVCNNIINSIRESKFTGKDGTDRILVDVYRRVPYKRYQDSNTPLNRILIRTDEGPPRDMADLSPVIASAEAYEVCRAYVFRGDLEAEEFVENAVKTEVREQSNGSP